MRFGHSANLVISMDDPREKEREERREGERGGQTAVVRTIEVIRGIITVVKNNRDRGESSYSPLDI